MRTVTVQIIKEGEEHYPNFSIQGLEKFQLGELSQGLEQILEICLNADIPTQKLAFVLGEIYKILTHSALKNLFEECIEELDFNFMESNSDQDS